MYKSLAITLAAAFAVAALTTATISIGAATPAFAAVNCNDETNPTRCSGGSGCISTFNECTGGEHPSDIPGGNGRHTTIDPNTEVFTSSGGSGRNEAVVGGSLVGGGGSHVRCENFPTDPDCTTVGSQGRGIHVK